jgi:class I fructose-bisphosphate aldolase
MAYDKIVELLGTKADSLLNHTSKTFPKDSLILPSRDFVSEQFMNTNRNARVLRNLEWIYGHGRLGGTGYVSILPVDQGIEHSAAASFAPNPIYFDSHNIVKLAIEGGATLWRPHSVCWLPAHANTLTRSHSL